MHKFLPLAALLALGACASSSGILPMGESKYQINATAITSFGGSATAQASARRRAEAFCLKQGKTLRVIEAKSESKFTQGDSTLTFTCE